MAIFGVKHQILSLNLVRNRPPDVRASGWGPPKMLDGSQQHEVYRRC